MTVGIAAIGVAPGAAGGVEHAPGWKHPREEMVTVVDTVVVIDGSGFSFTKSSTSRFGVEQKHGEKSSGGPPGKQEAMLGNLET